MPRNEFVVLSAAKDLFLALVFSEFDQHASRAGGMNECDALSLGAESGGGVDEADTGSSAAGKRGVEVVHGKADVVNAGTAFGGEFADWRVGGGGFEQLDERFAGLKPGDARTISVIERHVWQAEDVAIERQDLAECVNGDAHVGNACRAGWFVGHGECAGVVCAGA